MFQHKDMPNTAATVMGNVSRNDQASASVQWKPKEPIPHHASTAAHILTSVLQCCPVKRQRQAKKVMPKDVTALQISGEDGSWTDSQKWRTGD